MRGIRTEVVIKRVFANPQREITNGKNRWMRNQVMHEASSPKSGEESLWSTKENEAHKRPSRRKNAIKQYVHRISRGLAMDGEIIYWCKEMVYWWKISLVVQQTRSGVLEKMSFVFSKNWLGGTTTSIMFSR